MRAELVLVVKAVGTVICLRFLLSDYDWRTLNF